MRLIQYQPGTRMPKEHDWVGFCNHPDTDPRVRGLGMAYQLSMMETTTLIAAIEAIVDDVQLNLKIRELDGVTLRELISKIRS